MASPAKTTAKADFFCDGPPGHECSGYATPPG